MIMLNDVARDAMIEAGAHSATDITGFGLAGHAFGMAEGSKTTLVIRPLAIAAVAGARLRPQALPDTCQYDQRQLCELRVWPRKANSIPSASNFSMTPKPPAAC